MATPLVVNDVLRMVVACRLNTKAQAGLNVMHYKVTATGGMNLEAVPLAYYNRIVTQYVSWISLWATFNGVSVTRVATPARPSAGPFYNIGNTGGTGGSEYMPMQTSGIIRFTTPGDDQVDPPIKSGKGRIYPPFMGSASYNGTAGVLSGVGYTKLDAIRAVLGPSIILTGGATLQLVMRRTKTNPPPAPPTFLGFTPVTALATLRAVATQRRRGDFGRVNAAFGGIN